MVTLDDDFQQVTVDDIPLILKYLDLCNYEESNHNIVNLMLWQDNYPLWKCVNKKWLILLGIHEQELFVYMPLCKKEDFKEAILKAKSIFDHYEVPFVLSCFVKEEMDMVLELFPNYCACEVRDGADYVYLTEKFRTFSGKKLQKKRNHLNAFYNEYQNKFQYEEITLSNILECIAFLENWKIENTDEFLAYERKGILRIFELWEKLPVKGGLIRIDNVVKAFTIGSTLSSKMCQINVEKADDSIRGLYQAIAKEFLSHEFLDKELVNREDDIGKENLRLAKMSYYPEYLVMKYRLCKGE